MQLDANYPREIELGGEVDSFSRGPGFKRAKAISLGLLTGSLNFCTIGPLVLIGSAAPSAVCMVVGIYVLGYGLSAMRYSRSDHAANAKIAPVFHPWAIILGIGVIGLAYWVGHRIK